MVFPVIMFPAAILFALAELLIPELARCRAAGSGLRIQYLAGKSLKIALVYGAVCGGVIHLLAQPLCAWLYPGTEVADHLKLYSLLIPMLYCDAIVDAMVKGLGQQTASVRYNIFTSAMDVALLFLLLPRYGMGGYFISFLITHLINFCLSLRRLLRIARIRVPFSLPALTVSAWLLGLFGGGIPQSGNLRLAGFLGIFFSTATLFGVLSRQDLRWLRGLIKKK